MHAIATFNPEPTMSTSRLVKSMTRALTTAEQCAVVFWWAAHPDTDIEGCAAHFEAAFKTPVTLTAVRRAMVDASLDGWLPEDVRAVPQAFPPGVRVDWHEADAGNPPHVGIYVVDGDAAPCDFWQAELPVDDAARAALIDQVVAAVTAHNTAED